MAMSYKTLLAIGALILAASGLSMSETESTDQRWKQLDPETRDALVNEWDSKTPEEQEAFKQRAHDRQEKWNSMSPEQQQKVKERRQAAKDKWNQMSDAEKEEARKRFKEHRENPQEGSE